MLFGRVGLWCAIPLIYAWYTMFKYVNNDSFLTTNDALAAVVQQNLFSPDDCAKIVDLCKRFPPTTGSVNENEGAVVNSNHRKSVVRWVPLSKQTKPIYDHISRAVFDLNKANWNLRLTGMIESIQFSEYEAPESHFDWHLDIDTGPASLRKLSLVVQLSDENAYEGGELTIQGLNSKIIANRNQGNTIYFPSFLRHKVTSITKGTRYSLVLWISGPPFE